MYVVGNLLLYYQEGDLSKVVSPDLMVVFGASKHVRSSYRLWEEPKGAGLRSGDCFGEYVSD